MQVLHILLKQKLLVSAGRFVITWVSFRSVNSSVCQVFFCQLLSTSISSMSICQLSNSHLVNVDRLGIEIELTKKNELFTAYKKQPKEAETLS